MTLVKPLSGDFSCVVDPHEPRRMSALAVVEGTFAHVSCRVLSSRPARGCPDRTQRVVGASQQSVKGSK